MEATNRVTDNYAKNWLTFLSPETCDHDFVPQEMELDANMHTTISETIVGEEGLPLLCRDCHNWRKLNADEEHELWHGHREAIVPATTLESLRQTQLRDDPYALLARELSIHELYTHPALSRNPPGPFPESEEQRAGDDDGNDERNDPMNRHDVETVVRSQLAAGFAHLNLSPGQTTFIVTTVRDRVLATIRDYNSRG